MTDRGPGGRFLPGNPGRPPGTVDEAKRSLAELCRELTEGSDDVGFTLKLKGQAERRVGLLELVTANVGRLRNTAAGVSVQIEFLKLILAYGWGKPPQKIQLASEDESPDAMLREAMRRRNERLAGGAASDSGKGGGNDGTKR
jgi:hypothetical protein